jgi:hypothetical protein
MNFTAQYCLASAALPMKVAAASIAHNDKASRMTAA